MSSLLFLKWTVPTRKWNWLEGGDGPSGEALALKGPVVPVMIEDVHIVFRSLPDHLRFMLQGLQFF